MRPEKKFLVDEVGRYLDQSDYVFIADYTRITVAETAQLRAILAKSEAEYHVVKNSILQVAALERGMPDLSPILNGQNAIVVGGKDVAGVAKSLEKFFKEKQKLQVKGGVFENQRLSAEDVLELAKLPPAEVLKAQLLALFNTPATQMVRIIQAVPQSLLNVLQAKVKASEGVSEEGAA